MLRIIVFYVIPFIIPTLLYILWAKKYGKKDIPFLSLIITGSILMGIVAGATALWQDSSPAYSAYHAPKYQNGKIIPAHIENKNQ